MARRTRSVGVLALVCLAQFLIGCAPGVGDPPVVDLAAHDPDVGRLLQELLDRAVGDPRDAAARGRLGLAYEAQGMPESARTAYRQAALLEDVEPRWHYHLARMLAVGGDLAGALDRLDRVVALAPEYAPAHWRAGQWFLDMGETARAESAFRRALERDDDFPAARVGLARVFLADDRATEALELLLQCLRAREADPYLHLLLGTAYRRLGRLEDARAALQLARPVPPAWDDPWRDEQLAYKIGFAADFKRALSLIRAGAPSHAIPLLERLRKERSDDVTLLTNLGAAYLEVGRIDESKQTLLAALGHNPKHFGSHLNLSAVLERQGQPELALAHVELAIAANPFLARAYERKAALLTGLKRFDEAARAAEAWRSLEPGQDP